MARLFCVASVDGDKIDLEALHWLAELDDTYTILIEFSVERVNCDFAVIGQDRIAVLEVKGYPYPVEGTANGYWTRRNTNHRVLAASLQGYETNPIGQAKKIGDTFSGFLRRNAWEIFSGQDIDIHQIKVFPFVALTHPHPDNKINIRHENFCWVAQNKDQFLTKFKQKSYPSLRLSPINKAKIVELLDLEETDLNDLRFRPRISLQFTPLTTTENTNTDVGDSLLLASHSSLPEAWVSVVSPDGKEVINYQIGDYDTWVGRIISEAQSIKIEPKISIPIDDKYSFVSHLHCYISFKAGSFYVRDFSTNGTYKNGERLQKNELVRLEDGSQLRLTRNGPVLTLHVPRPSP